MSSQHPAATGGASTRPPRELEPPVAVHDLAAIAGHLRAERSSRATTDEHAITLVHRPRSRVVVMELTAGGSVGEAGTSEEYTAVVMAGSATLHTPEGSSLVTAPALVTVAPGQAWNLTASRAASLVLVVVDDDRAAPGGPRRRP